MRASDRLQDAIDRVAVERDELRLKIHLARLEAQEEWDGLEKKWARLRGKAKVLKDEAGDVSGEVGAAAKDLASELREGYAKLRQLM